MKSYHIIRIAGLLLMAVSLLNLQSCKPEEIIPGIETIELGSVEAADLGVTLVLYGEQEPFVGYNKLYARINDTKTGKPVKHEVHVTPMPMMYMPSHTHSSPVEAEHGDADENDLHPFAVVFTMPSDGDMSYWEIEFELHDHEADLEQTVKLRVNVKTPAEARMKSFITLDDSSKLFVSLAAPMKPVVGINDFALAIHKRETMMSFPAVEGYTIEIEPEMPTMGHGSPNNVNPADMGHGHYEGKVNFTMTGLWRVHVKIKKGAVMAGETAFDITF